MDDARSAVRARARGWVRPWRVAGLAVGAVLVVGALIVVVSRAASLGHGVGSTIANDWVAITVVSVAEPTSDPDIPLAADKRLAVVHIRFANRWNRDLNFNEVQFRVHDSQGSIYSPRAGTYFPYGGRAEGHTVAPGESVESDMVFVLPKTLHDAQLRFEPDGSTDIANFWWNLSL